MITGSFWMMAVNLFQRGVGVISTIVLARLLPPEDFGLVAMATVIMAFLQALTQFGFDVALIQKQDASREHYDTAWTYSVLFGITSGSVLAALAWPAAGFYDEPRIIPIMLVFAVTVFMQGFQNIGVVRFRKDLEFRREFNFLTTVKMCSFVVTITIAIIWRNYWALVIGTLTGSVVTVVLSYVLHDFRPRFSIAKTKELFSFSVWMFLNNVLFFLRTRGADLIVGRILGPRSLGLFTVGNEIANLPTNELIAPINRAIFPGYSKIANDKFRLRAAFLNVISIIAMVALPTAVGIAVVSDMAIPLFLGKNWVDAIPIVEVLAMVGLVTSLHSNTGIAYIALGRPYIHVFLQAGATLILFPLVIFVAPEGGIFSVACAYLIANSVSFFLNIFIASHLMEIPVPRLAAAVIRPGLAALVMFWCVKMFKPVFPVDAFLSVQLVSSMALGALVFIGTVLVLWVFAGRPDGAEVFVLDTAKRFPVVGRLARLLLVNS
jgi:PST family polysaccharide transporter